MNVSVSCVCVCVFVRVHSGLFVAAVEWRFVFLVELQTALPVGSLAGILTVDLMGSDSYFSLHSLWTRQCACVVRSWNETWMISPLPLQACLLFCLTQSITRLLHGFAINGKKPILRCCCLFFLTLSFFSLSGLFQTLRPLHCTSRWLLALKTDE